MIAICNHVWSIPLFCLQQPEGNNAFHISERQKWKLFCTFLAVLLKPFDLKHENTNLYVDLELLMAYPSLESKTECRIIRDFIDSFLQLKNICRTVQMCKIVSSKTPFNIYSMLKVLNSCYRNGFSFTVLEEQLGSAILLVFWCN